MQIVLETSNLIPFLQRNFRTLCLFSLSAALVAAFVVAGNVWTTHQPLFRDFLIANIAHYRAGPVIPFEDNVYSRGFSIDVDNYYAWGIESNNTWMADMARLIIPYFYYEKVAPQGLYPKALGTVPMKDDESFHVAGRMIPDPDGYIALLNERMFIDNRWNDQRRALEVLVHELVHVQGGAYLYGTSEKLETATSVATVEVLAALCNYDHEIACEAFWLEVEGLARSSLLVSLNDMGLKYLYDGWASMFWRDGAEQAAYDKSMRRWADNPEALMTIRKKYALVPWEIILTKYQSGGTANTELAICNDFGCSVLGMPFDDIAYLFRGFSWFME